MGRYEVVKRVTIAAVRPNLISLSDRIRPGDPTSWIFTKKNKEETEKGAPMNARKNLLRRKNTFVVGSVVNNQNQAGGTGL